MIMGLRVGFVSWRGRRQDGRRRTGERWWWVLPWTLTGAIVAVPVTAVILAIVAYKLSTPTDILASCSAVISLGLGMVTLAASFRSANQKTYWSSVTDAARVDAAKWHLATAVEEQWMKDAWFRDGETQSLVPVRWRLPVDPGVQFHVGAAKNVPQTASSAEIGELARKFRACEPRRLVILGGPGTGKTTLAVQLLLELLATRMDREDEPVPVTLPVAQWNTDRYPRLQAWLSTQLYEDYPCLQWLGSDGVRQMVDLGHVLPILDGLDELSESAQATVIERLNQSLRARDQLILTSRTAEYVDAVGSGRALDAAVLEPIPVTPLAAANYLNGSLQYHQANQPAWGEHCKSCARNRARRWPYSRRRRSAYGSCVRST